MKRILTIAAACLAAAAMPAHAAGPQKHLSIGLFPALRPMELVRAEHWLEDAGYKVAWHDFLGGIPPEAAAMAAGSIDFGEADTSGIEQVAAHSPGVMWYIADGASNYVALVARKGSGIKTVADLRGRKVAGVAPNTAPTAVLQLALAHAKMTLKDITGFNTMGPSEPAALERGAVDAAISYVPYSVETITAGSSVLIATASDIYGKPWPGGGIVVRPAFAKAHPRTVVAVLKQIARAEALLRDHPDQAYAALARQSKTSLANVRYAYEHKMVAPTPIEPNIDAMVAQASILKQFHVIAVPDVNAFIHGLVHPEFAKQAMGQ